jgi:hypothetical protein
MKNSTVSLIRHNLNFRYWAKERWERPAHAHPLQGRERGTPIKRFGSFMEQTRRRTWCCRPPG